jgi:hypothetical protein
LRRYHNRCQERNEETQWHNPLVESLLTNGR